MVATKKARSLVRKLMGSSLPRRTAAQATRPPVSIRPSAAPSNRAPADLAHNFRKREREGSRETRQSARAPRCKSAPAFPSPVLQLRQANSISRTEPPQDRARQCDGAPAANLPREASFFHPPFVPTLAP